MDDEPELLTETQQAMLETAMTDADRLRRLVQDFLTLSRLEGEAVRCQLEPISLQECLVISDFVFKDLYEGEKPRSHLESDPLALEIGSFSKTFRMSGWRCGYIVGHGLFIKKVIQLKRDLDSGIPPAIQLAAASLLREQTEIKEFRYQIASRRKYLVNGLRKQEFRVDLPAYGIGTNLVWAALPQKISLSEEAALLFESVGVKVLPGIVCGALGEGFLRFSLNVDESILRIALERINCITWH